MLIDQTDLINEKTKSEIIRAYVEIWKQIVAVQMHFNDLCIRTRWLGSTIITTIVGADLYVLDRGANKITFVLYGHNLIFDSSILLAFFAVIVWLGMKELDQKYYYKMLLSSVEFGRQYENKGLTYFMVEGSLLNQFISKDVPIERANKTLSRFYGWSLVVVIAIFVVDVAVPIFRAL